MHVFIFSPQFSAECVEDVAFFDPEPSYLAFLQGDPSIKKADIFESLALNCIAAAWRRILPNWAMESSRLSSMGMWPSYHIYRFSEICGEHILYSHILYSFTEFYWKINENSG